MSAQQRSSTAQVTAVQVPDLCVGEVVEDVDDLLDGDGGVVWHVASEVDVAVRAAAEVVNQGVAIAQLVSGDGGSGRWERRRRERRRGMHGCLRRGGVAAQRRRSQRRGQRRVREVDVVPRVQTGARRRGVRLLRLDVDGVDGSGQRVVVLTKGQQVRRRRVAEGRREEGGGHRLRDGTGMRRFALLLRMIRVLLLLLLLLLWLEPVTGSPGGSGRLTVVGMALHPRLMRGTEACCACSSTQRLRGRLQRCLRRRQRLTRGEHRLLLQRARRCVRRHRAVPQPARILIADVRRRCERAREVRGSGSGRQRACIGRLREAQRGWRRRQRRRKDEAVQLRQGGSRGVAVLLLLLLLLLLCLLLVVNGEVGRCGAAVGERRA